MLTVIRNGQRCAIPREIEAKGADAVEAYVTKQHGAVERPAASAAEPSAEPSEAPADEAAPAAESTDAPRARRPRQR